MSIEVIFIYYVYAVIKPVRQSALRVHQYLIYISPNSGFQCIKIFQLLQIIVKITFS